MKKILKEYFTGCLTVPNLLSFLRIVMVPIFAVLFHQGRYGWAVFVLALSGKIARRFNQISNLGKMLDPVADKLTQITIAIMFYLTFRGSSDATVKAFSWVFLVFLIKEAVMVVGGAAMIALGLKPGAAEMPGKVATFVFYLVMITIIAFGPDIGILGSVFTLPSAVMIALVCVSVVLTIVAFASYMPAVYRQLKEKKANK